MPLYCDNLDKLEEFVMPEEKKIVDLRPYIDHAVIATVERMLAEHENPSPEMVEEFCSMFENARCFTRMRMYIMLVKNAQDLGKSTFPKVSPNGWLVKVHQKVCMLCVATHQGNVPMTDAEKVAFESWLNMPRTDCKIIWSDES